MPENVSCKPVIYALVLVWLALSGSFEGWMTPALLVINSYLAAIILIWCGCRLHYSGSKPLTWPLIIYWAWLLIVTLIAGYHSQSPMIIMGKAIGRLYLWVVLFAVYHLPVHSSALQRGARWAGWLIFPLGILFPWENTNSMAMVFWAIYWLGLPAGNPWAFTGLAGLAVLTSHSEGGMLAMLAGGMVYAWHKWGRGRTWPVVAGLGLAIIWLAVIGSKIGDQSSFGNRIEIYTTAWNGITQSPWVGNGADLFHMTTSSGAGFIDQHNLLLNILWETGLVGLIIMAWLWLTALHRYHFPAWAVAWLVTFLCHSLVDGPLYASFITAVSLMMILGGLPCKEKITSPWPWPRLWPWRSTPPRRA